jgi:hypothetical protein
MIISPCWILGPRELHQFGDDAGGVLAGSGGWRVHVDLVGHRERAEVVAVRVEKRRQQRLAAQIHDFRIGALVRLLDVGPRAHGHDPAAFDGQRFGARLLIVDGDDVAARVDRVGGIDRRLRWLRCGFRRLPAAGQQAGAIARTREGGGRVSWGCLDNRDRW